MKIKQIFHHYSLWEDYKKGFYGYDFEDYDYKFNSSIELLGDDKHFKEVALDMIEHWEFSCEHNLTDPSINKVAYIGQASCCFNHGSPSELTKKAWWEIPEDKRNKADKVAKEVLLIWREEHLKKGSLWQS